MENKYYEDGSQPNGNEDELIKRIKECEMVVDKLENDFVWKIVIKDAKIWRDQIDSVWQEIDDEAKLNKARVIKTAYNHIIDLPKKYKDNLLALEQSLEKENEIEKDYED